MIDSHCHLDAKEFNNDLDDVVAKAKKAGVKAVVNPATTFASNRKGLEIAKKYKGFVFACAGLDPVYAVKEKDRLAEVAAWCLENAKKIVGIGEVGLEFKWMPAPKEEQAANFSLFIRLANELVKPVIVHSRNAMGEALELLEKEEAESVVLHYFSGSRSQAREAARRGYWVSLATNYCFMGDKKLIKEVPLENLLVETDSPYSSPVKENLRNEPANVARIIETVAKAHGLEVEEVARQTEENAREAFGL